MDDDYEKLTKRLESLLQTIHTVAPDIGEEVETHITVFVKLIKSLSVHFDPMAAILMLVANAALAESLKKEDFDECGEITTKTRYALEKRGYQFSDDGEVTGWLESEDRRSK